MTDNTESASLDNLLNGTKPEPQAQTPAEPADTAPTQEDTGDKQASTSPAEASETDDNSPLVPRKALIEERRKRQEFERIKSELEAKVAELSKPKPQVQPQQHRQPAPRPDPWTQPEEYAMWQEQQFAIRDYETRVVLSEELMSEKPDYEEHKRIFLEAAQSDPSLAQRLVTHPVPAKFVYQEGKRLKALQEIGPDPASYRERLAQQIREELMAEMQANAPSQTSQAPRAPAPKSLAGTTSAVPRDQHGRYAPRNGPASLDEILGG